MLIPNVQYIEDKTEIYASCQGPPTTMMALKFFVPQINLTFPKLYRLMQYKKGAWFFETYIVQLFKQYRIPVVYYSTDKLVKCNNSKRFKEISGMDFADENNRQVFGLKHYNSAVNYALVHKLFKRKKEISLAFIKQQIVKRRLVIATINRNILLNKVGYKGHFILIIGFNKDSFICNDSYIGEKIKIPFHKFNKAFYGINWDKPDDKTKRIRDLVVLG